MKNKLFTVFAVLFILTSHGCGGCVQKKNGDEASTNIVISGPDTNLIRIKIGDKVLLGSPQKFVEVYILFNYEYKKWVGEINQNTNLAGHGEDFLSKKRNEFYMSLGMTEDRFVQYSINHFKEIEGFLDKNPDYKKAYEDSLK